MRRVIVGAMVLGSLACGGAATVDEPETTGEAAGVPVAIGAPAVAMPGSFPATAEGACGLQAQCGCTSETTEACVGSMSTMPVSVFACIVAQDCAAFCAGGGLACVNDAAAAASAESAAGHDLRMRIIDNYPTGGACSAGQREVRDATGAFLYCQ